MKTTALLVFLKTFNVQLSANLSLDEVKCHCKRFPCNHVQIHESVVDSFQKTRDYWGGPIGINSGHRCQMHNKEIGGRESSFHLIGGAIDISLKNQDNLKDLYHMILDRKYFDTCLLYDTFLHCHNNILAHSLGIPR